MHFPKRVVGIALLLLALLLTTTANFASSNSTESDFPTAAFIPVAAGGNALFLPAALPDGVSSTARAPHNTQRTRYAHLNLTALAQAAASQNLGRVFNDSGITLDLFDGLAYTAFNTSIGARPSGENGYVWVGNIPSVPYADVIFVVGDGVFVGQITSPEGNYAFESVASDLVAIHEIGTGTPHSLIDDDMAIPDDSLAPDTSASPNFDGTQNDDGSVIDVMVVYTQAARIASNGKAGMLAKIDGAVVFSNTIYDASGVNFDLRLVHAREVTYNDGGGMSKSLYQLTAKKGELINGNNVDPSGLLDNVHNLRNQYGADLVALITDGPDACGLGWLLLAADNANLRSRYGFSVTEAHCLGANITFPHELGHNMGGFHDRANAPDPEDLAPIYPYAYGYQDPDQSFVTVMAYNTGGECPSQWQSGKCPSIGRFSAPDQDYFGDLLGSNSPPTNMVLTLNNTRTFVAQFRAAKMLQAFDLISPADNFVATDPALTFEWEIQPEADTYKLSIQNEDGIVVFAEDMAANCSGTCSFSLPASPTWKPAFNKDLKWTVTARKTSTGGTYQPTPRRTIIADFMPAAIALNTPAADAPITTQVITFEWADDTRIDEYQIIITDPAQKLKKVGWSARGDFGCNGTTCSANVDMASFSTPSQKGAYKWQVFGRRDEATGKTKSVKRGFTANFFPTPITLTTPSAAETVDTKTPTFIWDEVDGIAQYRVIVRKVSNGNLYQSPWTDAATLCVADVCTLNTLTVPTGGLKWEVWGRIPGLAGQAKSAKVGFKVVLAP